MYYIPNSYNEDDTEIDFSNLNSIQAMDTATELLEVNIIDKFDLNTKDLLAYSLLKEVFDNIAEKAYAYDQLTQVYKN
ncbi:hypothetical protein OAA62_00905 [bacterium]|nr:hypothetical protein [bacterium]